jgi:E3 ubiquitin-protein ligase UBR1
MRSGSPRSQGGFLRSNKAPGTCTLHARKHGSGIGVFFLVQKCTVLLMHNNKSAYSSSIYVDEHGEEDPGLRRGRPLFLNMARFKALENVWRQQGIPREVAQIRSTSDRVIRDNWY